MPTVTFASSSRDEFPGAMLGGMSGGSGASTTVGLFGNTSAFGSGSNTKLNIYQGSIPTFSTFTTLSSRSSDLLVTVTLADGSAAGTASVTINGLSYYRLSTTAVLTNSVNAGTAALSGTAAWFLLYNAVATWGTADSLTVRPAMLGTVGTLGSGADLEISSTSIVSGQKYGATPLILNFPLVWNV